MVREGGMDTLLGAYYQAKDATYLLALKICGQTL